MITLDDLQAARAAKWAAFRPLEVSAASLRGWVRDLGFADLPDLAVWSDAAPELLEGELAAVHIAELALWPGRHRYIPVELLGYVYVCVGDRHPRRDFQRQAGKRQLSWLAAEVYALMLETPAPMSSPQLRDRMGAERTSVLGIERALGELAATLKVLRVGRTPAGDNLWRPLVSVLPAVPAQVDTVSLVEAAGALVSQRLGFMICETEEGLAEFFSPLLSRARVRAALVGLEAGSELATDSLDGRPAFRLKPAPPTAV